MAYKPKIGDKVLFKKDYEIYGVVVKKLHHGYYRIECWDSEAGDTYFEERHWQDLTKTGE